MEPEGSLPHSQVPATCPYPEPVPKDQSSQRLSVWTFRNKIRFYGEELLASRPIPKLEDHPLSAARDCFFNIFAAISILEADPPSPTGGRAMPWWQVPTYHGSISVIWLNTFTSVGPLIKSKYEVIWGRYLFR